MKGESFVYEGYVQPEVNLKMNNLEVIPYGKDHIKFFNTGADIYCNFPTTKIQVRLFGGNC